MDDDDDDDETAETTKKWLSIQKWDTCLPENLKTPHKNQPKIMYPKGSWVYIYIYLHFVDFHGINAGKWILNGSTPTQHASHK